MMLNSIGHKIAAARKKANLSQAELAQHVSISPQAVGKWERGESLPDIATLTRLAELLGVDLNYFSDQFSSAEIKEPVAVIGNQAIKQKPAREWNMSSGNWSDADFSGLKNLKDKFSSSNIKNCKFIGSEMSGLLLSNNNMELCDFTGSTLNQSKFQSSNLLKNNFSHSSFVEATFLRNNIGECNFTETDFTGADFTTVNFEKNILKNAKLKSISFKSSSLSEISFEGTIEDAHFESCSFHKVKFQNAILINTFFKYNRRLKKVEFINCKADTLTYAFLKNNQAELSGISLL